MGNFLCTVFEDEEPDIDVENMDKERLEELKKRRQSRQLNAKALAATCAYMEPNLPAGGGEPRRGSKPGSSGLEVRRGSNHTTRRGSVMVVPPKPDKKSRERTDSIF